MTTAQDASKAAALLKDIAACGIENVRGLPADAQEKWTQMLEVCSYYLKGGDHPQAEEFRRELRRRAGLALGIEQSRKWLAHVEGQAATWPNHSFQQAVID